VKTIANLQTPIRCLYKKYRRRQGFFFNRFYIPIAKYFGAGKKCAAGGGAKPPNSAV
jgi:hypothetical protein